MVYGACFQKGGEGRIKRIIQQDTAGVAASDPNDAYVDQEGLPPIRSTDHFGDLASQEYDLYTSPDEEV